MKIMILEKVDAKKAAQILSKLSAYEILEIDQDQMIALAIQNKLHSQHKFRKMEFILKKYVDPFTRPTEFVAQIKENVHEKIKVQTEAKNNKKYYYQ